MAGVISRIDRQDGIYSSPGGQLAQLNSPPITQVERAFNNADASLLVPANVNPLVSYISPLVVHVYGSRTTSDDASRKYVAVSRFLRHLEFSMDQSLETALGSPATDSDVTEVEALIGVYLNGYWSEGAFVGATVDEAYYVDCAIASPGINCTIGVAIIRPFEFALIQLNIPYLFGSILEVIFETGFEEN